MKHGKKPTRAQKKFLTARGLRWENWFVCMDTPTEMLLEHRHTSTIRRIKK